MAKSCKLIIQDEVNIKFEGVDLPTRRKLKQRVEYFQPHARHTPAYRLGRWDGKMSFCDTGGRSYFNLLDRLVPVVVDAGYEVEIEDRRQSIDIALPTVDVNTFSHKTWPKGHPAEGEPVVLRDYQAEIVDRFMKNPQCVQEVATGAGKTLMTAAMSYQAEQYGRSIVIVPNKDLVVQTEKDYINLGLDVGVYYGDRKEYNKTHTICTWQSLEVLIKNTETAERDRGHLSDWEKTQMLLEGTCWCCERPTTDHAGNCVVKNGNIYDFIRGVNTVIVDEVHKAKADVLRRQLSTVFRNVPIRWGLTGTVPKDELEEVSVTCALGSVVGQLSSKELQDAGILSKLEIDVVQLQDPPMAFPNYAAELKWLTTDKKRLAAFEEMIRTASASGNTLVLVDRLETGRILVENNPNWVFISGATKSTDRQTEYEDISTADNRVIVATYGVAAVGINIPRIFNLFLFEPGKSFVRVIQSIGRGIRKAKDKDFVQIYDVCSSHKYSKKHLTARKKYYKEQEFPFRVSKVKY